jgi:hypothetical protein
VVIFIPLQLTLGRMVECIRDHVHILDDLPNGVTREGVNGSQSKFLEGTQPISQNQFDAPLFYLGQDRTAIAELPAFGTRLGTAAET